MAELEPTADGFILIENHCPICKAATRCPSLCQSELNVFRRLLGEECHIDAANTLSPESVAALTLLPRDNLSHTVFSPFRLIYKKGDIRSAELRKNRLS